MLVFYQRLIFDITFSMNLHDEFLYLVNAIHNDKNFLAILKEG